MPVVETIYSVIETFQLILLYGWPFILLIIIVGLKLKWKRWPIECEIIEKRGGNLIKTNDRAGRYVDPYSGLTGYKLQKNNDTIPVIDYQWVLHNVFKATTLIDKFVHLLRGNVGTLFLFKYGAKQYKPIWIKQAEGRRLIYKQIKDLKGNPILLQVYEQFDPRRHLGALDFEVIDWDNMNFMVQEQRASFERRQRKKEFWKQVLIPIAALVIVALVCIIMIKFSYDYAIALKGSTPPTPTQGANIPIISGLIPAS